ncbi:MAG: signal peptidase I [Myxococcota bacterium]
MLEFLQRWRSTVRIALLAGLVWVVRASVVTYVRVPDDGMMPGIRPTESVVVDRLGYRFGSPETGDIVVFRDAEGLRISRIAALPGETVRMEGAQLFVDDAPRPALGEGTPTTVTDAECAAKTVVGHDVGTHTVLLDDDSALHLPPLTGVTLRDDEALVMLDNLSTVDAATPGLELVPIRQMWGPVRFRSGPADPCPGEPGDRGYATVGAPGSANPLAFYAAGVVLLAIGLWVGFSRLVPPLVPSEFDDIPDE